MRTIRTRRSRRTAQVVATFGLAFGFVSTVAVSGQASVIPGTTGNDVHFGHDNDNADNTFLQPPGVDAKQHMDNTDVVFGRDGNDLLVGNLGDDTVIGGKGHDITIGGPEDFTAINSDVLLGDEGDDINIWAPGDGSDAYVGDVGYDTMVLAPFVTAYDGSLKLERFQGRKIPRVDIANKPQFACEIVPIPPGQDFGAQFLVRFFAGGDLAVTIRLKDVEQVLCATGAAGKVAVADLTDAYPDFTDVRLGDIRGVLGAIVAAP